MPLEGIAHNVQMGTKIRLCHLTLFLCAATQCLIASTNHSLIGPYFNVSSIEQGWQPSTVTAILQSKQGYLWLGTYNGLWRYDGVRFTLFDSGNTPGLKNSRITSLYEDSGARIWIGHETGELTRLIENEFEPISLPKSWPGSAVEGIFEDENKAIWLLSGRGLLFRFADGKTISPPKGGSTITKTIVTRTRTGQLWMAANGAAVSVEGGEARPLQIKDAGTADYAQAVVPLREGGFWLAVNGTLKKYDEGEWQREIPGVPGAQAPVTAVLETRQRLLLIGTLSSGLFIVPPKGPPLHFSRTNGLSHDWVRSLFEDHEGNIWIGTGAGLDTLRQRKVRMLNPPDAWQGRAVLSFTVRPDRSVWIGTEGAGLYHYDDGQWAKYDEGQGLVNTFVWSVLASQRGELFAGTWGGGLLARKGDRFEPAVELSKTASAIVSLFEGSHGETWIGTTTGLYRYEGGKVTWSAGEDKLALADVRTIAETKDGTIWFGMLGGGLGTLKQGVLKQFRKTNGLCSDFVQCLLPQEDGSLWIGTADAGLARLKDGKFFNIGASQGLPDRSISHFVDDGAGIIWMGSHRGILRANKAELNSCADGETKGIHCLTYGKAEGLATETCSGGFQPGACKTEDGLLWFPTSKGLAIIDSANVSTNKAVPPVVIENFFVDGKPVSVGSGFQARGFSYSKGKTQRSTLEISPGKHRFEVQYTALSFVDPEKVYFRYKLEGLERDWIEAGPRRVAEYSYLTPASYHFRVVACNNDGVWNESGDSVSFIVQPWFWQTRTFQIVGVLAISAGIAGLARGITRRRMRAHLDQVRRRRALEFERARIARDIHDDLGAGLTRISLLSQSALADLDGQTAATDVEQIYGTTRELTRAMDEIVWAVNPRHDSLDSLVTYLGRYAQAFLSAAGIRCRLDVPVQLPSWLVTAEVRHSVFLAFKEALNNTVKHARASEVRVCLELRQDGFLLTVTDNGVGFNPPPEGQSCVKVDLARTAPETRFFSGNGLANMRKRLEEVGGYCEWKTAPGEGTRVCMAVTVKETRRHQK